jgi:glycosyltransferase involved in cell wall biosynthesis
MSVIPPSLKAEGSIVFVLKGYPRLSETFIAQEILALERRGLEILIASLRHPTDHSTHPIHELIRSALLYLPEYLYQEPRRVWRGWVRSRRRLGYRAAKIAWLADLRRDPTPNRIRRFGQALVLAAELPENVNHLHAHFLHTPASVARYAALITGLSWTVSAHAKDIWTVPAWEKRAKLAEARWVVTCTEAGRSHLAGLSPHRDTVALCYHGLDLERFAAAAPRSSGGDGSDPEHPVMILSVGRLVPKKGYEDLLAALALLPPGLEWRFVHVGGGTLGPVLKRQAAHLGLSDKIEWRGALAQPDVLASYRQADLFVLASKVAKDGDRDGLPNVLIEAQSQRLACVATDVSAIPELIEPGVTGILVPPNDPVELARAIGMLIDDPATRDALGAAGVRRVHAKFAMKSGIDVLAARFRLLSASRPAVSLRAASRSLHDTRPRGEDTASERTCSPIRGVLAPQRPER